MYKSRSRGARRLSEIVKENSTNQFSYCTAKENSKPLINTMQNFNGASSIVHLSQGSIQFGDIRRSNLTRNLPSREFYP